MKRKIALLAALLIPALLATHVAFASPAYKRSPSINTNVVMTYTFPITETGVDSLAFEVNGLCSVVFESAGSDDASLYAVPTGGTATGSGTLIVAYTDSSTVPTVFQPGTRWVRAVAVSAATGGSVMRITCSNTQIASTGEACGTSGLAPYVGTGGRYKCEPEYAYDETTNQLSVGEVAVDANIDKNVIRMERNASFTGANPTATEVLLYPLAVDNELYVENLDGVSAPSRVVTASPDYYDVVLEWGVAFLDVDNEYLTLTPGATTTQKFCMVKAPHVDKEKIYTTSVEAETITIPLTGFNGCSGAGQQTTSELAYALMGDPYVADAWCTTTSNIASGFPWATGDEVVVRFAVSNQVEVASGVGEYGSSIYDLTYGYDEILIYKGVVSRHAELRDAVDAFASTGFVGAIDSGGLKMTLFSASIESMTQAAVSTWNNFKMTCSLGILFKDTR